MKWDKPTGSIQQSHDGCYVIMRATAEPENWVSYSIPQYDKPAKLGEFKSDAEARTRCEDDERELLALRKAS